MVGEESQRADRRSVTCGDQVILADVLPVLAVISRHGAQDVLSLFTTSEPIPFRTVTLSTSDAQSLSWSQCGRWLAILDTPLVSPSLHVYTADGHAFRTYPSARPATPPTTPDGDDPHFELGSKSVTWSPAAVVLLDHSNTLTMLLTKTFSQTNVMDAKASVDTAGYQESISATGHRSYAFLSGETLPRVSPKSSLYDIRSNTTGTYLSARDEAAPSNLMIWDLTARSVKFILTQYTTIKKVSWHPQHPYILLLVSEDNSIHLWDVSSDSPPIHLNHAYSNRKDIKTLDARWIAPSPSSISSPDVPERKISLLITTKRAGWTVIWPNGRDVYQAESPAPAPAPASSAQKGRGEDEAEADETEDSLYDILTGRTPLPGLQSSGKVDDRAVKYDGSGEHNGNGEDDAGARDRGAMEIDESTTGLDDTFREKRLQKVEFEDDSEIF